MNAITSKLPHAARLFVGLAFFVFGLNGFLGFMPQPPLPESAGAFMGALAATGYMFPLIKGTEVVAGLLLLSNRFVPLALILLAPIVVNIVAFHAVLAPGGVAMGIVLAAALAYLGYAYRASFAGVLSARAQPAAAESAEAPAAKLARA